MRLEGQSEILRHSFKLTFFECLVYGHLEQGLSAVWGEGRTVLSFPMVLSTWVLDEPARAYNKTKKPATQCSTGCYLGSPLTAHPKSYPCFPSNGIQNCQGTVPGAGKTCPGAALTELTFLFTSRNDRAVRHRNAVVESAANKL